MDTFEDMLPTHYKSKYVAFDGKADLKILYI